MTTIQQLARQHEPQTPVVFCDYCKEPAEAVTGREVYPERRDLWKNKLFYCAPCQAWVGCHRDTGRPLGRLANAQLRKLKQRVHALFDPLWRHGYPQCIFTSRRSNRADAYAWLAKELQIAPAECHVGMFDEERCLTAIYRLRAEWVLRGFTVPAVEQE